MARRTRAGIDQAADKPGFPAFARAVFHSLEEAVGCEVAKEAAARFGGITAETSDEIEVFLQLGVGSDRAGKLAHFVEVLLVLDESGLLFRVGLSRRRKPRAVQGMSMQGALPSHCQGSDRGLLVDPHSDGLAHRLDRDER
jgi:hypothetical protein